MEALAESSPLRFRLTPPRQAFCDPVHERHATLRIGRDDGITDASQRHQQALFGSPAVRLRALAIRDVGESDGKVALVRTESGDRVPPIERLGMALEVDGL